jgi:hypothetical protein
MNPMPIIQVGTWDEVKVHKGFITYFSWLDAQSRMWRR